MRLNFALSSTFLLARAGAEIGPHLLDGTDAPTFHRDIAQSTVSIEDLLTPFAGKRTGLAFRVHADNDAKTTDGGVADAIVAALRETGLPADPAEAVAVLTKSPVPLSITLQYEYIEAEWPVGVKKLAEAFGETNGRAEVEGGLLLHAYLSTAGAAALPSHSDLGDILVVQLSGSKTWTLDDYVVTLEPGDGLVIPADTRHAARATEGGGVSAHLTIHRIRPTPRAGSSAIGITMTTMTQTGAIREMRTAPLRARATAMTACIVRTRTRSAGAKSKMTATTTAIPTTSAASPQATGTRMRGRANALAGPGPTPSARPLDRRSRQRRRPRRRRGRHLHRPRCPEIRRRCLPHLDQRGRRPSSSPLAMILPTVRAAAAAARTLRQ